ncbi:MAG: glutamate 5-kinase [Acidobacteriota bacterium]
MSEAKNHSAHRALLGQCRRIVVKVGSGVLVDGDYQLDDLRVGALVKSLSALLDGNIQVVLVTSGAVAAGMPVMGLKQQAKTIPEKQACAAVGQSRLMALYERAFSSHGHHTAQILLTQDDVRNRERYLNSKNAFEALLSAGILPIVNENDTVVVEEIKFGDNDNLSAQVAALVQADLLLMLSSVEGFYETDPSNLQDSGKPISVVERITEAHFHYAQDRAPSGISTGGMKSKLLAIQKATHYGVPAVLASGLKEGVIERVLSGEEEGTLFLPQEDSLSARKHWILHSLVPRGSLTVDRGAVRAIVEEGRSLLPIGISKVEGDFSSGHAVRVLTADGTEVARGLSHYSSSDVKLILGRQSEEIESLLGYSYYDEVIHRDNLVLVK